MGSSRVAKIKGKSKNSIIHSKYTVCHHLHEAEAARAAVVGRIGEGRAVDSEAAAAEAAAAEVAVAEAGLEAAAVVDQEAAVGEVAAAAQTEAGMQGVESGQEVDSIANSTVSE